MKFLVASPPMTGHLNPVLSIGRILMAHGHEVVVTTGSFLRPRVEATGARFIPLPPGADLDTRDMAALFPAHQHLPPDLGRMGAHLRDAFIEPLPHQLAGLRAILAGFDADAIISSAWFSGTLPLLLDRDRPRPVIIHCGLSILVAARDDGAPVGSGLPLAETEACIEKYRSHQKAADAVCFDPMQARTDQLLAACGAGALPARYFDAIVSLPDLYLQLTVPGFEYPRRALQPSVRFIGNLPVPPSNLPNPSWIGDLDGSRRVVLVTQGTVANFDLGQVIAPTLAALANEPDLLVLATTGGQPLDAIPVPIPGNARIAEFLPFERLLPRVDVVVTNGGYGTVNLALKAGVPLVVAGLTEDKAEVSARVAWSGAGINLATNQPEARALRHAVRAVLDTPDYRVQAARLAAEFATYDTEAEILRLVPTIEALRDQARERYPSALNNAFRKMA
jgi:UDP:flavonoid glycosyltransferase YjiC (YdhE family)